MTTTTTTQKTGNEVIKAPGAIFVAMGLIPLFFPFLLFLRLRLLLLLFLLSAFLFASLLAF